MSHKVLFAARVHIQAWKSTCRSPGEDGLVRSSPQVLQGVLGWAQAADSAASLVPGSACPTSSVPTGHLMGALPLFFKVMPLHATHCFRTAPWEPDGRNWSPGLQSHCRNLEKLFFFFPERFLVGFFFPSSPHIESRTTNVWKCEILKLLTAFLYGAFEHSGSLFTVYSVSSSTQNYEKHIYLMRTKRWFFPKPSAAKLLTLNLLTVWSLAISSPTYTRNTIPTVFSKSSTTFLCDALAQSHFSLMFKLCQGWLTTQTILSVN